MLITEEKIKECMKQDLLIADEYLEAKNNNSTNEVKDHLQSSIKENGMVYNELVNIEINEDETTKLKIKEIQEYGENLEQHEKDLVLMASFTGFMALLNAGAWAFMFNINEPGASVLLPVITFFGTFASATKLTELLIENFDYHKNLKQYIEEIKENDKEAHLTK